MTFPEIAFELANLEFITLIKLVHFLSVVLTFSLMRRLMIYSSAILFMV